MPYEVRADRAWFRRVLTLGVVLGTSLMIGCIKPHAYLEPTMKEIPVTEFKKPEPPKVAHMTFEFRTKGAPNARATKTLTDQVKIQVKESGLFANVDAPASPEVGLLGIAIDNVALADQGDAKSKGFATGFTFGLVGTSVSDGYVCTLSYLAPGSKDAIVKTTRNVIHSTIGNANPPAGAIPTESPRQAADIMVRQILSHALHDLSVDPQF
jgi:hypothetical protein